jgi:type IV secretory pathway TraG/TraD family ATPase VirD4
MSVMHGTGSLLVGYLVALAALVGVLVVRRSGLRGYLLSPLLAAAGLVVAGIVGGTIIAVIEGRVGHHLPPLATVPVMALCLVGAGGTAALWLTRRGTYTEALKRGTALVDATRVRRLESGAGLRFGGIDLPKSDETKHFKIIGTTGTGKSTAIRELLEAALARGDRAVFADPDFGYLARFYDPGRGDVILNPFDPRSVRWDLYSELRAPYDYDQLARALIGDGTGSDKSWRGYAQTFFAALLRQTREAGICELGEFYRLLTSASVDELRTLLDGTPAQPFLEAGNERMFASVRTVASASTTALDYIRVQRGEGFSLRKWIEQGAGVLFLPYRADQIAALRSVISTWMRIAIFQTMSQAEADHRLWFVIDELDALGAIDGLKDALARLRKFGGRCVLGFQSIAQVSGLYGESEAQTIVENCGNTLILRCSASERGGTALFASRLIGEREIIREKQTRMRSGTLFTRRGDSMSSTIEQITEHAVMPSEIEQLPDFTGYLKLASRPEWLFVQLAQP